MTDILNHVESLTLEEIQNDYDFIKVSLQSTAGINCWDDFVKRFNFPQYSCQT
jgi:hypothetical protein